MHTELCAVLVLQLVERRHLLGLGLGHVWVGSGDRDILPVSCVFTPVWNQLGNTDWTTIAALDNQEYCQKAA